ncbi:MAG: DUF5723 family protein [Bacteroidales bacterium]|nr:DUF5723 family protein [Bacteroidales bacterium]
MKGERKYILSLLLVLMVTRVSAQNSQILYYMNLPQNHLVNPALRSSNSLYIGLPVLSGINMNINNNFVNFSDVFMKAESSDSIITFLHPDYDVDDFIDKIYDKNSLEPEIAVQLFGLGFSVGKSSYVFLDITERVDGNTVIPGNLLKLVLKGNEQFIGDKIDLSSLRGDLKYYREIGLGFSKDFSDKLRIGIKGKLLFGIAGASIDNRLLGITVNEDYSHTFDADLAVNISGPVKVIMDENQDIKSIDIDDERFNTGSGIEDFLLSNKNMGLGFDIGATYNISEKLMVSAAITDIGYIRWKKEITNLKSKNQFEFSGLNMVDVVNRTKTFDEVADDMLDSLKNAFKVSRTSKPFTTWLPYGITLGGSYNLTDKFSVGLLSYSRIIGRQIRESLTLSANVNLGNSLSTSLGYTFANHRVDNIGAGLAFRAGFFQFYMLADRIPIMWNKVIIDDSTIPLPSCWNTVNLRLGMNIVFGNKVREKNDKPMILVE